ncbi:hypothetical protein SAMN05519104_3545 [Rhizobiales bacterium GAS188]|nr:hypothetical protein SAMN05519104_3545 [Rhizobiales bacterium GAS188]
MKSRGSVCGTASEHRVLMSTNAFGSPDLNLRPPKMQRSTMSSWLQECPNCGFVSSDLGEVEKGIEEILASEPFTSLHRGALAGSLIGRFLKRSLVDEELGNTEMAAKHALRAAWAADDADDRSAVEYRSKAADLFLAAASAMPTGSEEWTAMRTRTIDILRRARRWDEAVDLADALLAKHDLDATIRSVVEFERRLVQAGEQSRYTIEDAISG